MKNLENSFFDLLLDLYSGDILKVELISDKKSYWIDFKENQITIQNKKFKRTAVNITKVLVWIEKKLSEGFDYEFTI